jgi:hypothetical protein
MKDLLWWLILFAILLGVMGITAAIGGCYDDDECGHWLDDDDESRCN